MSRIGKKPVAFPANVKISVSDGTLNVEGPKGKLSIKLHPAVTLDVDSAQRIIKVNVKDQTFGAVHGTTRALINNMVVGVVNPFEKRLEINGVGYGAKLDGKKLVLTVGFAKPVEMAVPAELTVEVSDPLHINIRGSDKQKVGHFAAVCRKVRPPEPYKAKGIRYFGEIIRRKAGKAFVGGGE